MKGNDMMLLPQLKKVVRSQDIRYPGMLSMKKADLIRNMKKRGMWESGMARGGPKSARAGNVDGEVTLNPRRRRNTIRRKPAAKKTKSKKKPMSLADVEKYLAQDPKGRAFEASLQPKKVSRAQFNEAVAQLRGTIQS